MVICSKGICRNALCHFERRFGFTGSLTTGVDNFTGTGGSDTFIADNSATVNANSSAADTLNGGEGTDTLKIFTTGATALTMPALTSIEALYINGGALTAFDASAATITGGGVKTLSIDSASANVAATYTLSSQDLVLASKTSTAATTTTVAAGTTSTHTSQNITLNAITRDAAANISTVDVTGTRVTTLNLTTTGVASNLALANTTGAAITTINVAGNVGLTFATSAAMSGAVTTVNASTATGAVVANLSAAATAATFKFTGGTGNDTISFADNEFGTLTAGTQLDGGTGTDKIGLLDTAISAAEATKINAAVGFETIGLNADIAHDASSLTIKNYSIDTTGLTQTINSLATGSAVTVTVAAPVSLTLSGAVGVSDVAVNLGAATTAGVTVGTLVTTGLTTIALSTNGTAANAITTLTNSDNSIFTVTGSQALTMTLSAGTSVGSTVNGAAATGILTLGGSTVIASGDILVGGTAADVITGGRGADKMTGNAGADRFVFNGAAGQNVNGTAFGTNFDEITDFLIGTDKLQITNRTEVVSTEQAAVVTAVAALAAGSTAAQIATAMATASTTNLGVSFATFGGNTYVLFEATGASTGVIADDVFIKLTGVTSLPSLAVDFVA